MYATQIEAVGNAVTCGNKAKKVVSKIVLWCWVYRCLFQFDCTGVYVMIVSAFHLNKVPIHHWITTTCT